MHNEMLSLTVETQVPAGDMTQMISPYLIKEAILLNQYYVRNCPWWNAADKKNVAAIIVAGETIFQYVKSLGRGFYIE